MQRVAIGEVTKPSRYIKSVCYGRYVVYFCCFRTITVFNSSIPARAGEMLGRESENFSSVAGILFIYLFLIVGIVADVPC